MNYRSAVFLLITAGFSVAPNIAQAVQVPENCIGRISPCLVRTEGHTYKFLVDGQQIFMLEDAILKISFDQNKNNIEVIEGRISLQPNNKNKSKSKKSLTVNGQFAAQDRLLMSRFADHLTVLNLKDYILKTYSLLPAPVKSEQKSFELVRTEFINKKDFVSFTKYYFQNSNAYNRFLAAEAPKWRNEFKKQNNHQTKVLQRSIASETEKSKIEAERSKIEAAELKKLRAYFFYRTFNR